ncbi:hypothetical protein [Sphingomonas rubra]|uniref:Uncharacterized protein n=1 Tax=Sphingomonas rubra TaxID=634430 RepID=A0A1I5PQ53_9SPHN|nr:hypothetical protein [Sphingomonas rubra]SFP36272.1 hypothetical protein SAMN04488241_101163 [Sphingomonas rubra]
MGSFGKEQSGTRFGKMLEEDVRRHAMQQRFLADRSFSGKGALTRSVRRSRMIKFSKVRIVSVAAGIMLAAPSMAVSQVTVGDPDLPIAFTNVVPDVCFGVANGTPLTQERAPELLLEHLNGPPAALRGTYAHVPNWYRAQAKPRNIFVGVGDAPGRCHVVLADTKDAKQAYRNLSTILRATGFSALEDKSGRALTLYVKHGPTGNMLVLLKGLTDADDGNGPQVSVDVSSASDDMLKSLLSPR